MDGPEPKSALNVIRSLTRASMYVLHPLISRPWGQIFTIGLGDSVCSSSGYVFERGLQRTASAIDNAVPIQHLSHGLSS